MKKILMGTLLAFTAIPVFADEIHTTSTGSYIIPDSSIRGSNDRITQTMRSFNVLFKPNALDSNGLAHGCETPASLACVYGLSTPVAGCPINGTTALPTGGAGKTIAIVDAYDNPNQTSDLAVYSAKFGLPTANLTVISGKTCTTSGIPAPDAGWADEHTLDLEMVHAMAPNAKIYMVEAESGGDADMMQAEQCASTLVSADGGGFVSNSWGSDEYNGETARDVNFRTPNVVYVFSSGDYSAPARYPSSSPYVISAGGTSILRDANGNFTGEAAWSSNPNVPIGAKSGGSGGPSLYEPRPIYQMSVAKIVSGARGTPDISFDADPATGVCVYSSYTGKGWIKDGGTSVAAPALSGILATSDYRATSSQDMLSYIYGNAVKNYHSFWHDGLAGNNGYPALSGYDFVTGLGSPLGYHGK